MTHITLAIGIIIGGILYSLVFTIFQPAEMNTLNIIRHQQYSYVSYIPAFLVSFLITKSVSLKSRLPRKISTLPILIIGVWLSLFLIIMPIATNMGLGYYLLHFLPFADALPNILSSSILRPIAYALIYISLFSILLESQPKATESKPE